MHHEVVCHFGECTVADHDRCVLNNEVHQVRGTPYAQDLIGGLLIHERHKSAFPSGHGVLTVRADRQQLVPPKTAELVEQLSNHLADVYDRVAIVEWDDNQMDVEHATIDTDADAHIKEWHALMSTPIAGERERPDIVVVQDIREDLQVGADVDADHLADLVIFKAHQFPVAKHVLVLPDHSRRLLERQADWHVL